MRAATAGAARRPCRSSACRAWRARRTTSTALAQALAGDERRPRCVIALDYRGRGQSDYDRDPDNYSFQVELADVLAVITALDAMPAVFVGTSRGGILVDAARRRAADRHCRRRAQRYRPGDRAEGTDAHQGLCRQAAAAAQLRGRRRDPAPAVRRAVSQARPRRLARRRAPHFQARRTAPWCRPTTSKLAKTLEGVDFEKPLPPLWKEFDALAQSAGDGDPRRQFRHPVAGDRRGHARAPRRAGNPRSARSGPRAAVGGADTIARILDFVAHCGD